MSITPLKATSLLLVLCLPLLFACSQKQAEVSLISLAKKEKSQEGERTASSAETAATNKVQIAPQETDTLFDKSTKTIHILVALCDNANQGIVPVPAKIGNGQDPFNNLYWGAAYGIKTYFKRSSEWKLLESSQPNETILERLVFKHNTENYYLVADAYDGKYIKQTTEDFLSNSAGLNKTTLKTNKTTIGINGNADLVAYIGHDGLMEFEIDKSFVNKDGKTRDLIILACYSKSYFQPHLIQANTNPMVWTTGLMAPEAYTIHDAITGYIKGETNEAIRTRAAQAYSDYQKCSLRAAKNLLVSN